MNTAQLPTIASLCAGYGGLEQGVADAIGGARLTWYSEIEPAACRVLEHHNPGTPNVGDLTVADYGRLLTLGVVDILAAGWPCQPWSLNGLGLGVDDPRHLWPHIGLGRPDPETGLIHKPGLIATLRPRLFVGENVLGHLARGFAQVIADLHLLGYDAYWTTWNASNEGAPHKRGRLFVLGVRRDGGTAAIPSRAALIAKHGGEGWMEPHDALFAEQSFTDRLPNAGAQVAGQLWAVPAAEAVDFPYPLLPTPKASDGERGGGPAEAARNSPSLVAIASLLRAGPRSRSLNGPAMPSMLRVAAEEDAQWGAYAPAIRRWEATIGRPAPAPTVTTSRGNERLTPEFVEWCMGLRAGHVTGVPGLTRGQKLKMLGNGVVVQQCAAAVRWLLSMSSAGRVNVAA